MLSRYLLRLDSCQKYGLGFLGDNFENNYFRSYKLVLRLRLKSYLFQNQHWHRFSICFPPTFEFLNSNCARKRLLNDLIKIQGYSQNPYVLSELILMAKIMRKKNFKIQMLAGNTLKIGVSASFEISTTLVAPHSNFF